MANAERKKIDGLKASRSGFKATVTRVSNRVATGINNADPTDEAALIQAEFEIKKWEEALERYVAAEEAVMASPKVDPADADGELSAAEDRLARYTAMVRGRRKEFDKAEAEEERQAAQAAAQGNPAQPQAQGQAAVNPPGPSLPKLVIDLPPILEEDTDLIAWLRWKPTWTNYAGLLKLAERDQRTQVSVFWQSCSPGFQKIINHTLGIGQDTVRPLDEILNAITDHLRSLRNRQLDLREYLSVRQRSGQDYVSLCNEIRELGEYANVGTLTTAQLHIGVLILAMRSEQDRAKLINENPNRFEDARAYILGLETARKASQQITKEGGKDTSRISANRQTSYRKGKWGPEATQQEAPKKQEATRKPWKGQKKWTCHVCDKGPDQHGVRKGRNGRDVTDWCQRTKEGPAKTKATGVGAIKRVVVAATTKEKTSLEVKVTPLQTSKKKLSATLKVVPDTGAGVSVMGTDMYKRSALSRHRLRPPVKLDIVSVEGRSLTQRGSFKATVETDGAKAKEVLIVVCDNVEEFYLDLDACKEMRIVSEDFPRPMPKVNAIAANGKQVKIWDVNNGRREPAGANLHELAHRTAIEEDWPPAEVWKDRLQWIESLPDDASPEDIAAADKKMREVYASVFDDSRELKPMRGPGVGDPMVITLREGYVPFAMHGVRPIPYAVRDKAKGVLDYMVARGIVEKVGDEPSEWCHPIVIAPKPDGDVRFCADLTRLNSEVLRTSHHTKTPVEAINGFEATDRYFLKLDLVKGYWQMPLAEESRPLTTFATPWGRYRWLRSPMGFVHTGDSYTLRGDIAMEGLPIQKVVDDIGAGKRTFRDLVALTCDILERCARHGLTVNPKKSTMVATSIDFVGYKIGQGTIAADPRKIQAVRDFPIPETLTDLRSFMGLVTQLGSFSAEVSQAAEPLRCLLSKKNSFIWHPEHGMAFEATKAALVKPPILAMFDPKAETILETDAARTKGLGFSLRQRNPPGEGGTRRPKDALKDDPENPWRLVTCGSRFLSDPESRYAMIELEALGIYWAIKKCRVYLAGLPSFTVIVDHQPLKPWFNHYQLASIENPRVLNYRMKLLDYNFTVEWRQGKNPGPHAIPDALSRAPVEDPTEEDLQEDEAATCFVGAIIADSARNVCPDLLVDNLRDQASDDPDYQELFRAILHPSAQHVKLGPWAKRFKQLMDELSVCDGLIVKGSQIVVPPRAIQEVLKKLHEGHQGIVKTKRRARQIVYWPDMTVDIATTVKNCRACQELRPSPTREPLQQDVVPSRPFEMATSDLFQVGTSHFAVYADRYSGYPLVAEFSAVPTTSTLIRAFRKFFSMMGVPNRLRSDQGPQYESKQMQDFLRDWAVQWTPSSPHNPQSNGHAEVSVKAVKHLLKKCQGKFNSDEFHAGLLELRNAPREDGLSPAQRLFGHPLRSRVPAHWRSFDPQWQLAAETADRRRAKAAQKYKAYYDESSRRRLPLKPGTTVLVKDHVSGRWDKEARIAARENRRYRLVFPSGRTWCRNAKFLREIPPTAGSPSPSAQGGPRSETPPTAAASERPTELPRTDTVSRPEPRRGNRTKRRPRRYENSG